MKDETSDERANLDDRILALVHAVGNLASYGYGRWLPEHAYREVLGSLEGALALGDGRKKADR